MAALQNPSPDSKSSSPLPPTWRTAALHLSHAAQMDSYKTPSHRTHPLLRSQILASVFSALTCHPEYQIRPPRTLREDPAPVPPREIARAPFSPRSRIQISETFRLHRSQKIPASHSPACTPNPSCIPPTG